MKKWIVVLFFVLFALAFPIGIWCNSKASNPPIGMNKENHHVFLENERKPQ